MINQRFSKRVRLDQVSGRIVGHSEKAAKHGILRITPLKVRLTSTDQITPVPDFPLQQACREPPSHVHRSSSAGSGKAGGELGPQRRKGHKRS